MEGWRYYIYILCEALFMQFFHMFILLETFVASHEGTIMVPLPLGSCNVSTSILLYSMMLY